jgi:hypothetical protein
MAQREPVCFECRAADGVLVRLTKDRYNGHILAPEGHPDLECDFRYPASMIQQALENAVEILKGNKPDTRMYYGPDVIPDGRFYAGKAGRPTARQFVVVVKLEDNATRGLVVTAYAPIVRVRGATR